MRYDETDGVKGLNKLQLNYQHSIIRSIYDVYNVCACSVCNEYQGGEMQLTVREARETYLGGNYTVRHKK